MEVILKEDVPKLGNRGDVVRVAEGYGRNYLLPRKLAIRADAASKNVIEQMKAAAVRRSAREKGEAEQLARQFEGVKLVFHRKTGERDQLFGSVTAADLAQALERQGLNVDRRKIHLNEPLKSLGEYTVPIRLHREVTAPVQVVVLKEGGEAESPAPAEPAE
ncbi:MAG TPA: 50S ribosomal protein L9 [Terriglobales bacterium]|nr:50S ribosomal protein L9 [Terriglobales bacterium]